VDIRPPKPRITLARAWIPAVLVGTVALVTETYLLAGLVGLCLVVLGSCVALDVGEIATYETRKVGFGPFWSQQSRALTRLSGVVIAIIGLGWSLALLKLI
jgi:hypothetical protein